MRKKSSKKKKLEYKKKTLQVINFIIVIALIILVIEIGYGIYYKTSNKEANVYFDGINSIIKLKNGYSTVGSNNNNDNFYERAKFTIYNNKREKIIEKIYNKGYNSAFFDLCETNDNGFVVVGSYEANKREHDNSIREALIVKYNSNGDIVFESKYRVLDNSKFTRIISLDDGYIVVGQSVYKSTKVGNDENGGAIIVKYNLDGKKVWEKSFGNNKSAIYNDVIKYNNYIYVVGKSESGLGVINKYDLDGNIITSNDYRYTDSLGFSGIVELNNHLFVSTGKRINASDTDAMIVKYDMDLNYIKEESYNGGSVERFSKIIKDSKDHIVLIGVSAIDEVNSINYDGLIAKYNDRLDKIAVVSYGDEKDDYFNAIINDDSDYLVVGYSSSEDNSYYSKFIKYSDALKVLVTE